MKATLSQALEAYRMGDLGRALWVLGGPEPQGSLEECEARTEAQAEAGWPASGAIGDWVGLARDRLRYELGEEVVAVCPVVVALQTALGLVEAEVGLDAGLEGVMRGVQE